MGDERYVQVKERAEAYAAWYEKERVTAHIAENCREEAEQILAQADSSWRIHFRLRTDGIWNPAVNRLPLRK